MMRFSTTFTFFVFAALLVCFFYYPSEISFPRISTEARMSSDTDGYFDYEGQQVYCKLYKPAGKGSIAKRHKIIPL